MSLLEMKDICKSFSGVYANENVHLTVEPGQIRALLGENGAGKTTLVNILFGLYEADQGEIFWKGQKVSFRSPRDAIRQGIGMVQQHFSLVQNMNVTDNIILNLEDNTFVLNRKKAADKIRELGERYGLQVDPKAMVSDLSIGEQQRVEILKALYRDVELLILDEPTGVLTPQETEHFFDVLRNLKKENYGIIIITHRMSEIMAISDVVTIMRDGKVVAELETGQTGPAELSRYMIGRELHADYGRKTAPVAEELLRLDSVRIERRHIPRLKDISFVLHKGEILGVAGVEGNGQKELAEVITGILHPASGRILLNQEQIERKSIRYCYEAGISYISDDRHHDGLVMDMSVAENAILRDYMHEPFAKRGIVSEKAIESYVAGLMERYRIKASGRSGIKTPANVLSGGNQQKLIVSRELTERAKVIVASQPTRGLDIGATEFVRDCLLEQRNSGKGILLISADLEEIMALSDRIVVMFNGAIQGILSAEKATVEKIGLLMGGIDPGDAE